MTERIVKFFGYDGEQETDDGAIIWDGHQLIAMVGPDGDETMLQNILDSPVFVPDGDDVEDISPEDEPERWFDNLNAMYRGSTYPARDLTDDDLEQYKLKEA